MEKLKPCPFCGPKGNLEFVNCPEDDLLHVICMGCGCCGPAGKSIDEAISVWNRRKK